MKKKIRNILFILLGVAGFITILHASALNTEHPENLINVTKSGETSHGSYELTVSDVNPDDVHTSEGVQKSNYIARVTLSNEPGYYVKNFTVKLNDVDLVLGFIAGSEQGAFFREKTFTPVADFHDDNIYEFFIPESTTEQNKVEVNIEYAQKDKINISYMNYTGNQYDNESLFNQNNYGEPQLLVEDYMDGDLVLPESMMNNGGALIFQFNQENYDFFKEMRAEAVTFADGRNDNLFNVACDDEALACYVVIHKDFKELSIGSLLFGYNNVKVFVPNYAGFDAEGDVNNFNDQDLAVGFNPYSLEDEIEELFYGTKVLTLYNKVPNEIINDNKVNNCGPILDFDNVSGSGYGYTASYDENIGTLVITFSSFYQNEMVVELSLTKNNQNIFSDNVKIKINRFAFSGQMIEVDADGRNCQEQNNGNRCNEGRYYSIEYRGVLSAFYTEDNSEEQLNNIMVVDSMNDEEITLGNWNQSETAYERNKNFTPYALALFYDNKDMIVGTKIFNLNDDINGEGYVSKDNFIDYFNNRTINQIVTGNYIRFDNAHRIPISQLDHFSFIDNASIMHQIVLISKDEAEAKNIKKIALFLVNGEIEENEIPSLTYGIGEGKVLEIRTPMEPAPNNDNGGGE